MNPKELASLKKVVAAVIKENLPEGKVNPAGKKRRHCPACVENQPNQMAHYGGCLPDVDIGETWSDMEKK
jgi:hypothetical protein